MTAYAGRKTRGEAVSGHLAACQRGGRDAPIWASRP